MIEYDDDDQANKPKQLRGLALLSPERRREIAAMGGRKAHELGKCHEWTQETAKAAGQKGSRTPKCRDNYFNSITGKAAGRRSNIHRKRPYDTQEYPGGEEAGGAAGHAE